MAEVSLSFISQQDIKENRDERIIQAKRMQSSIFARFTAKRGAGRVERYFVKLRAQQVNISIQLVSFFIVLILVVVHTYLNMSHFHNYFSSTVIDMATPIRLQTFLYTTDIFYEANYFSKIISNFFSHPSVFLQSADSAFNISQLEIRALKSMIIGASSFSDCGFSTGSIISSEIVDFSKEKFRLYMSYPSDEYTPGLLCTWDAFGTNSENSGFNASFPNRIGDCETDYLENSLRRNWYQYGVGLNRSTWTNIYYIYSKNSEAQPSISSVSPSHNANGEVSAVFSFDITLDRLSKLLSNALPAKNSRFAVISQLRAIVGVTGDETPVDFYKGDIVTKTLPELRDQIWELLIEKMSEKFSSTSLANYQLDNISTYIEIDDIEYGYSIYVRNFTASSSFDWTFLAAICLTDMFNVNLQSPRDVYLEAILPLLFGWLLYFVFKCIYNYLIDMEQNRLLTTKSRRQSRIVTEDGIDLAVASMKKLMMSHADNKVVLKNVAEVLGEMQSCNGNIYFSSHNFYTDISNSSLRKKFIQIYGPDDLKT